jgi:hypothetical protein
LVWIMVATSVTYLPGRGGWVLEEVWVRAKNRATQNRDAGMVHYRPGVGVSR